MGRGFDCYRPDLVADRLDEIVAAGYEWVAFYGFHSSQFKVPLTLDLAKRISAKLEIVMVYENGFPTSDDYFTSEQGETDAHEIIASAKLLTMPTDLTVPYYYAVDYDMSPNSFGRLDDYAGPIHDALKDAGLLTGPYGSGIVCQHILDAGTGHFAWLSQSTAFPGYEAFKPKANIVQGPSFSLFGIDCDSDETTGKGGGWRITRGVV
jgi:hypothetical protein